MKLSLEQNEYFDTMAELFMSKGWRLFVQDFEDFQEAMSKGWRSMKPENLAFNQGRAAEMDHVISYQEMIEATKKSLEEAPEPDLEPDV